MTLNEHRQWYYPDMDDAILTKFDSSSVIIEQDTLLDKLWEVLLPIIKRSWWLSFDDEFSEGLAKKIAGIDTPKKSTIVAKTRLRS